MKQLSYNGNIHLSQDKLINSSDPVHPLVHVFRQVSSVASKSIKAAAVDPDYWK